MTTEWNQQHLQRLIDEKIEESQSLEYKAVGALSKANKEEITKDVSAMANAGGGTIIYGISEFSDKAKKYLPEKLSPVIRTEFGKEWLEQVINNIKPRIDNLVIHPVSLDSGSDHVAYVVEVPQGATAHQALDFRYYRRYNFEVRAMVDDEIRDVMARKQHPLILLSFEYTRETWHSHIQLPMQKNSEDVLCLNVYARNSGKTYAKYVNCVIDVPKVLLSPVQWRDKTTFEKDGVEYCQLETDNTHRDVMGRVGGFPTYGPSRYDPMLPGPSRKLSTFRIGSLENAIQSEKHILRWVVYADNASPNFGEIASSKIPFTDKRFLKP
jgi:hypothetical protein